MSVATFAAAQLLRAVPRVRLSRAVGRLCERPLPPAVSKAIAEAYSRVYRIELHEVDPGQAPYESFDAFFTRKLRADARPVDDAAVVSPADGRVESAGPIDAGARIRVKSKPYEVGELIGDNADARRYRGGSFVVVYLSPRDYHRVHSPVTGDIVEVRGMAGDLYPVNAIGERHVPRLFVRNHRAAIVIDTADVGRVTVVMVGAVIVGRITVTALGGSDTPPGIHAMEPSCPVRAGEEIGIFHLGSTAVVLVEPGVTLSRVTGTVRFGESLVEKR